MLEKRVLWDTAAPDPRSALTNWPTVLFSWWCTSFAAVIIITRVLGRKVRSDRLFREDWIMLVALAPLFIRMIFIHFVLIYGTNNVDTTHHTYTELQLYHRSIGSRLVLCSRIFYAMFIWFNKLCLSEFLKRITIQAWRRSWEYTLRGIRIFLFATFFAVVVATLAECYPLNHYWQVVPDPGAQCRQGYAQLLTMGTCDIVTDILLIAFPIPVVLRSGQNWKRKTQMILLFSLSIIMIVITATRMPQVILHLGRQQYRTVWASCEILAAAAVSNGVILGSFLRDKGTKRQKYRNNSFSESIERTPTRRTTVAALGAGGSDEDLFHSLGCRVPSHLQGQSEAGPRLAPPALPAASPFPSNSHTELPPLNTKVLDRDSNDSAQPVLHQVLPSPAPSTTRSASFFDVGNLLDDGVPGSASFPYNYVDSADPAIEAQDFAGLPSSSDGPVTGSSAFLRDVGGMLPDSRPPRFARRDSRDGGLARGGPGERHRGLRRASQAAPVGVLSPTLERRESQLSLQDAGGLLGSGTNPIEANANTHKNLEWTAAIANTGAVAAPTSSQQYEDDIELEDIGGLLSVGNRRTDRPAMSLQEMLQKDRARPEEFQRHGREGAQQSSMNNLTLSDPGGLMKG